MAGASGDLELSKGSGKYHFPKGCPFCVLLQEDHFKEFAAKLAEQPDITHVFLVTDSVEAFHEMAESSRQRDSDASSCTSPIWTTSKSTWSLAMRIEPKDFQDDAVLRLTEEIESARREIDRGRPQAVVLSSPTGSGKTVIMTLLMERLWAGHESISAGPRTPFSSGFPTRRS